MVRSDFLDTSSLSIGLAQNAEPQVLLSPNIGVIGVGGAGGNAVANMIESDLMGVSFLVANTDAQALAKSLASEKIQLGVALTQGLGAGSNPEMGKASAEESADKIEEHLKGLHLLFITAGMGGGTGTGAAPVIAQIAKRLGIMTVGVVSKPFKFEGIKRMRTAEAGVVELQKYVDTLLVIPNQNLFRIVGDDTTFADAFKMADDVLTQGVRSITDLILKPGLINLDFADVRTVIGSMGRAIMGTGEASGDNRAMVAVEKAISNPLLDDSSIKGAKSILINIAGGLDLTLAEVDSATERIAAELPVDANIIFGTCTDEDLHGRIRVSLVATGIERPNEVPIAEPPVIPKAQKETVVDVPSIPDLSDIFHEEKPAETQPELLQASSFFEKKEEVILPSQQKNDLAVEITEKQAVPEQQDLIEEEVPVIAPPITPQVPPALREEPSVEIKPEVKPAEKPFRSSFFDLVPSLRKSMSTKKETKSKETEIPTLSEEEFTLPAFLRRK